MIDSGKTNQVMTPASTAGRKLFDDLRTAIESGQLVEGDRIAPIRELAAKYGIAFDTARATVGQLEKMAFVQRRRGAGTFVTPRGQAGVSNQAAIIPAVGLLLEAKAHLIDNLAADLVDLLQQQGTACIKLNWRREMGMEQIEHVLRSWRSHPPRAVVVQSGAPGVEHEINKICGGKTAIILTFRNGPGVEQFSSVNPDYNAAYLVAAQAMRDRGHKRVGFVTQPRLVNSANPSTLRRRTTDDTPIILSLARFFRNAGIAKHGLSVFRHRVDVGDDAGLALPPAVERCMAWLQRAKPTGVMGNDFLLMVVSRAAEALGLKVGPGGDLELIGVGNTPWAEALNFDSVSLREDLIARHVANLIISEMNQPSEAAHHITVAPKLVIRAVRPPS